MRIKKAILTGGGRATRLRPVTLTINKHLIPLANKPMIFHAIEKAVEAGIEEIFINTNPDEKQLQKTIGDGSHWGIKISFFEQEGGPQGIAHVVKCAEKFIGDDPFMFYLSDNIILGSLEPFFDHFDRNDLDCLLAFAEVPDPTRFGMPVFDASGALTEIIEKPDNPLNNFAQTGIYLYGPKAFYKAFEHIKRSPRGEYEISDIHTHFLKNGYNVGWREITGWWKDTGKPDDLVLTNKLLMDEIGVEHFAQRGTKDGESKVMGKVYTGVGTTLKNVTIEGPVMIGENCTLENCTIGPYVTIGSNATIKNSTILDSMLFANIILEGVRLKNSIIGEQATMIRKGDGFERVLLSDHAHINGC